jgi:hypothetical protein
MQVKGLGIVMEEEYRVKNWKRNFFAQNEP